MSKLFRIAGESPNEDRSEGEDPASTPNTATTTSSPKKESEKESEKIIPGKKYFNFCEIKIIRKTASQYQIE